MRSREPLQWEQVLGAGVGSVSTVWKQVLKLGGQVLKLGGPKV